MTVDDILDALRNVKPNQYPREAIDDALSAREEVRPELLALLRDVGAGVYSPTDTETKWDVLPLFASLLLGYFREPEAHVPLIDILSLPADEADAVFGTSITEDCHVLLARTYPGSPSHLFRLLANEEAYLFCRTAASRALALLVAEGKIEHSIVVSEVARLLNQASLAENSDAATLCVDFACDIHPAGLMPLIQKAFDQRLVDTFTVSPEDIAGVLACDVEVRRRELLEQEAGRHPEDFHAWTQWWYCWKEPDSSSAGPVSTRASASSGLPSAEGTRKRRKRKTSAKAAAKRKRKHKRKKR